MRGTVSISLAFVLCFSGDGVARRGDPPPPPPPAVEGCAFDSLLRFYDCLESSAVLVLRADIVCVGCTFLIQGRANVSLDGRGFSLHGATVVLLDSWSIETSFLGTPAFQAGEERKGGRLGQQFSLPCTLVVHCFRHLFRLCVLFVPGLSCYAFSHTASSVSGVGGVHCRKALIRCAAL